LNLNAQTNGRASILTAEQRRQYERDGFLVLPGYFDTQTVEELSKAADEVLMRVGPFVPDNPRVQVDQIGDEVGIRQAYPVVDLSETLARFAAGERMVGLFRSLFDGDTPVLFEDKLNYKHPHVGTPFPMHQDYSYWQDYSPRLTSALLYIDEATIENGCLEVVSGWHKKGLLDRSEMDVGSAIDHHVTAEVLDPALAVAVPGKPGTVILFSCLTPHTSAPNRSAKSRRALILTYNPAKDGSGYEATSGQARDRANAWLTAWERRKSEE
jgi:hypothetical protein